MIVDPLSAWVYFFASGVTRNENWCQLFQFQLKPIFKTASPVAKEEIKNSPLLSCSSVFLFQFVVSLNLNVCMSIFIFLVESVVTRFDQISNNDEIIDIYIYLTKVTSFFIDSIKLHILSNTLISLN